MVLLPAMTSTSMGGNSVNGGLMNALVNAIDGM
jgi:hypothetical protein